jgi:hypothetical protein
MFSGGAWPNCTFSSVNDCPTNVLMAGNNLTFGTPTNLPQGRLLNNSQWQDNGSWVHGRHTFKFGGEYDRQRSPNVFIPNANGAYSFTGIPTGGTIGECQTAFPGITTVGSNGLPSTSITNQTCSFSRFLANQVGTLQLADGPPKITFREQDLAVYFGNDWRIMTT